MAEHAVDTAEPVFELEAVARSGAVVIRGDCARAIFFVDVRDPADAQLRRERPAGELEPGLVEERAAALARRQPHHAWSEIRDRRERVVYLRWFQPRRQIGGACASIAIRSRA